VDTLSVAYQRVWESFQRNVSTEDGRHDTPRWRAHTGPYAACIVRVPADPLQPRLESLRGQLAEVPGVRLHPDHFLHIMLQELGFVADPPSQPDEISASRLEEFAQSVIEPISSKSKFALTLSGVNSFHDAVFLEVKGGGPVVRLHERLFDLAAVPVIPAYPYLPHCTVAHYDGTTPQSAARSLLTPWRNETLGAFLVAEAEIVTLDSNEPYPEMTTYAAIPFKD
jgi:2'-5' RNA ligase